MKKNLFDYAKEDMSNNEKAKLEQEYEQKFDEQTKTEVKDLYNKYKNYSQDELLNEFLTTSKQKIKQGSLSKNNLQNTINNLSPFINTEQKKFLDDLIKKIDE